jgi:drug/metabolite transporter (DMT)-like permease
MTVATRTLPRALPYAAVAAAAITWGTWSLVLRHAEAIAPMSSALESAIVMAVLTAVSGVLSLRDRSGRRAPFAARAWMVWLGVADALNVLLFFAAYKITISVAVLAHYLAPIFVAIASPFLLRERITPRTALAVVGSFVGLAVMLGPGGSGANSAAIWQSAALGAGSALFYASNVIGNKFVVDSFSTSEVMFWHGTISTPLLALCVPRGEWASIDAHAATFLAVLSIGPGALAGLSFVWGLRRMQAAHASTLTLLEPLVAVVAGSVVFGEALGARALAGGALILAGALTVMTAKAGGTSREPSRGTLREPLPVRLDERGQIGPRDALRIEDDA